MNENFVQMKASILLTEKIEESYLKFLIILFRKKFTDDDDDCNDEEKKYSENRCTDFRENFSLCFKVGKIFVQFTLDIPQLKQSIYCLVLLSLIRVN